MPYWALLDQELERWSASGRVATLWWRDDDATALTPALERLLSIAAESGVGVGLAVIPAGADRSLAERLHESAEAAVLQHGYAHVNHEPAGIKACEFGNGRGEHRLREELRAGLERLHELFGGDLLPVFVPPWNRIGDTAVAVLAELGVRTLSTYRPRATRNTASGLLQVNCHADLMDWRGTRGFIGTRKVVSDIAEHLRARRTGAVDDDEPTGILTHHLAHDEGCWVFLRTLFERTAENSAARWLGAGEALCPA